MSVAVTFNGSSYIIPTTNDTGWGTNTTNYLVAIAAGCLQKTGGTFLLSAETDFGAAFGLKALYYKSRTANVANAGILRLASNSDSIAWRNNANSGNLLLNTNASDELLFNSQRVLTGTGPTAYVSSITGTANQVIASSPTGAITLSLPQSLATTSALQFATLGLGAAVDASAILSASSTTKGFLPPRMTQVQRDAIVSPATGLVIYNTDTAQLNYYSGAVWTVIASGGGSGTVNVGTTNTLAYYPASTNTVDDLPAITTLRALQSDASGLPIASTTTATELAGLHLLTANKGIITNASGILTTSATSDTEIGYVSGVTSAIQTQINTKAPLASPTFTGEVITANGDITTHALTIGSSGTPAGFYKTANGFRISANSYDIASIKLDAATGNADDTQYAPITFYGGSHSGDASGGIESRTASVTTAAKTIFSSGTGNSGVLLVYGENGAKIFVDMVLYISSTTTPVVVSSTTSGSPDARTYAQAASGVITLQMAAGTYNVSVVGLTNAPKV